MKCPRCGKKMVRRLSKFNKNVHWWGCTGWPKCTVTWTEHPDGSLMSTPADYKVKALRMTAHKLCDRIWGAWNSGCDKIAMYDWLKKNTRTGHIGKSSKRELEKLISKLKLHAKEKNNRASKKTQAYENKGKQAIQRNDNCNERS